MDEAFRCYSLAAEQGNHAAEYALCVMYVQGEPVEWNPCLAAEWCRKAAEGGYAHAQYFMGYLYTQGLGVGKNLSLARDWLNKAIDAGHAPAQEALAELERML